MGSRSDSHHKGARRRPAAFLLALLFLATIAACTDILGISERTLSSSSSGSGGATGGGGSGGSGGTGGQDLSCASDADCADSAFGPTCDPATSNCVECLPGAADGCAFGLFCDVTKTCAIGCADDADCNPQGQGPLVCLSDSHQCSQCGATAACPPGTKCDDDTQLCVSGCSVDPDCPTADWSCCGSHCKNVTKDLQNCGACDDPCEPDQSTTWLCLDGGCVFQSCTAGHADCNQDFSEGDGCEVNLDSDPANCGACKKPCMLPHAGAACAGGECAIGSCVGGYENCNGKVTDGCEANLASDAGNCGGCNNKCGDVFPNAVPTCSGSTCVLQDCNPGSGDCDGNEGNGCETDTTTSLPHCGGCGDACTVAHGTPKCMASECTVASCDTGFGDCTAAAGCETNLNTSPTHCGTCAKVCGFAHAAAACNGGDCLLGACNAGFGNCDGNDANGCETDLSTTTNCGACGTVCGNQGATSTCNAGTCSVICDASHMNCDGAAANGCEINITNNVNHCGTCANLCPTPGGAAANCVNKVCGTSSCGAGTADCDNDDTCETNLTDPTSCGACGNVCSTNHTSSVACTGSPLACAPTCAAGFGNCDNNPANGCEQPLNTIDHCTACGSLCQIANANVSCSTGSCKLTSCKPGYADCNGNPSDGCEVQLATNTQNCGACNAPCNPAHANGACVAGSCTVQSCNSGYLNCNASPNDGCEVNKQSDIFNCGTCGNQCSFANGTPVCDAPGVCHIGTCTGSFNNCDGNEANGCEANLQTSTQNCGACGTVCGGLNASASCSNFSCTLTCNNGYANCNGLSGDGCETSTHTLSDCGACATPCNLPHASESCATGTCQITSCDPSYTNCDGVAGTGCECASSCSGNTCQGCGDGFCNGGAGETCASCSIDCGTCQPYCGDQICNNAETCSTCPGDCLACPQMCGDLMCNGSETCGNCPGDCGPCPVSCGDGVCSSAMGETCMSCPADCPGPCASLCGDGTCDPIESCMSCPTDCGPCASSGAGGAGAGGSSSSSTSSSTSGGGGAGGCSGASGVQCAAQSCGVTGCCYPMAGAPLCAPPPMCGPVMGAYYACDDLTECPAMVCCHTQGGGSSCTLPGSCTGTSAELCKSPSAGATSCECSGTQQCCPAGGIKDSHYPTCQPMGPACK